MCLILCDWKHHILCSDLHPSSWPLQGIYSLMSCHNRQDKDNNTELWYCFKNLPVKEIFWDIRWLNGAQEAVTFPIASAVCSLCYIKSKQYSASPCVLHSCPVWDSPFHGLQIWVLFKDMLHKIVFSILHIDLRVCLQNIM